MSQILLYWFDAWLGMGFTTKEDGTDQWTPDTRSKSRFTLQWAGEYNYWMLGIPLLNHLPIILTEMIELFSWLRAWFAVKCKLLDNNITLAPASLCTLSNLSFIDKTIIYKLVDCRQIWVPSLVWRNCIMKGVFHTVWKILSPNPNHTFSWT